MNKQVTSIGRRRRLLMTAAIVPALTAAACGGHSGTTGTSGNSPSGQVTAQQLASFSACMSTHGITGLHFQMKSTFHGSDSGNYIQLGGYVAEIPANSPQFSPALKACRHLLPLPPPPSAALLRKRLAQQIKFAACLRTHGYPDYPDPAITKGVLVNPALPADIDANSPAFQSATQTCSSQT